MHSKKLKEIREKLLDAFKDLEFNEEEHKYTLRGKQLPSVSSLLENFYEKFNSIPEAEKYADKRGFLNNDVSAAWLGENKIATDKGHKIHNFSEDYANWKYFGIGERPTPFCKQSLGAVDFWNNLPDYIVPVALELRMYNEELGYSGTADIICCDTRDYSLAILDTKTNKALVDVDFPQKPLYHLPKDLGLRQDNFGKYSLQLSFYQIMLEKIGFKVKGRVIIWLDADKEKKKLYKTYQTINVVPHLLTWLSQKVS